MTTEVNPITLQVVTSTLSGIVREMQSSLFRTGYSTILRESHDASCGILDKRGRLVGQYSHLYFHLGTLPATIEYLLQSYPLSEMEEGDVFISNHPYFGGSCHVSDMAVVTPVFFDGELVAFCGSMAHKSDVGGATPGSSSGQAREIYQEGFHIPPVRFASRYRVNGEIEKILRSNSRTPELLVGDMMGQIGSDRIGELRLQKLMEKYGKDTVLSAFDLLLDRTEKRVRLELSKWEDTSCEMETFLDNDGIDLDKPVRLHLKVTKQKDSIVFDFTQSAKQTVGPVNMRPPLSKSACYYGLIAVIDPTLPNNEGLARVVETRFSERSVLNPSLPAPVSCYAATTLAVTQLVLGALCHIARRPGVAGSGLGGALVLGGWDPRVERPYVQYEMVLAGAGAIEGYDGSRITSRSLRVASTEILEAEFPIRLLRFDLIPDSGGAGKYRGSPGTVREYLILGERSRLTLRCDKFTTTAEGVQGGLDGKSGAAIVNPGTKKEKRLPARIGDYPLEKGDVLRIVAAGGGGVGDPMERDMQKIRDDIEDGYISEEQARIVYGLTTQEIKK